MIVKNERANLERLLPAIRPVVDELCVCDTGSTDGTQAVTLAHGARLIERAWSDNFAHSRNHALSLVTDSKWALWLDADDYIEPYDLAVLKGILQESEHRTGFFLALFCDSPDPSRQMTCNQLRVHPVLHGVTWVRRVHEQVIQSCAERGTRFVSLPIRLQHLGYDVTPEKNRGKLERNLRLLQMESADAPHDLMTRFHIAQTLVGLNREAEAFPILVGIGEEKSNIEFVKGLSSRAKIIAANILKLTADKQSLHMFEEAVETCGTDDYARVGLAARYMEAGMVDRVRPTIAPIRERGGMQPSLMPYPIEVTLRTAKTLWANAG